MEVNDVSFIEALQRLDAIRDRFTDRVLDGEISVWAGSAISQTRFPNLGELLTRLLCTLHREIEDPSDPADPAIVTIGRILDLADVDGLSDAVKPVDHIDTWPPTLRRKVIDRLWYKYSDVLAVSYRRNDARRSLAIDVLEVDKLYADPAIHPDAEHRLLALLIQEGALQHLLTTNWDPLIERAHCQAAEGTDHPSIRAIVFPEDLLDIGNRPRLNKIHGCADRAQTDGQARKFIVATVDNILDWLEDFDREPIREVVTTTARSHGVLYLGLSGQDVNILLSHVRARLDVDAQQAVEAPRVFFSTGAVGPTQEKVLRSSYGNLYDGADHDRINDAAVVPLYAKPLLGGLLAFVLREKLYAFAASDRLGDDQRALARRGVDALVHHVATVADGIPAPDARWRYVSKTVALYVSSFNCLFETGTPLADPWTYYPLTTQTRSTPSSTQSKLALLIGVLAVGAEEGRWELEFTPEEPEQLRIHTEGGDVLPVYIVCDKDVTPNLLTFAPQDRDCLVIHTQGNSRVPVGHRPQRTHAGLSNRASRLASADDATESAAPLTEHFDLYLDDWTNDDGVGPVDALHHDLWTLGLVNDTHA